MSTKTQRKHKNNSYKARNEVYLGYSRAFKRIKVLFTVCMAIFCGHFSTPHVRHVVSCLLQTVEHDGYMIVVSQDACGFFLWGRWGGEGGFFQIVQNVWSVRVTKEQEAPTPSSGDKIMTLCFNHKFI
jgi:hypothetical protein